MNRIDKKFTELHKQRKKAFIAFITAGDPSLKITEKLVVSFEKSGADIIELGIPFSDPLADGPTIQAASQRALKKNVTVDKIFSAVRSIRRKSQIPIALMTYYNPVFHYGEKRFIENAKKSDVDGVIIPDLPPEEAADLIKTARQNKISTIFFLSPTTKKKRIDTILRASTGFVYYVSLTGVTGARKSLAGFVAKNVRDIKKRTSKPICVGFGVSNAKQVNSVARFSDGVIVGSAIINTILRNKGKAALVKNTSRFVSRLVKGL